MLTVKIGRRGQITIPSTLRRYLGVKDGDMLALIPDGEQAIIKPVTGSLLDIRGSVPVDGVQDFDSIRKQVQTERSEK